MKCLAILSLVFASTIFASCCSIQGMKEPQKTIIYKYFARRSTPITIVQCFEKKFYFNILLDDKAGFDPETDWSVIKEYLNKNVKK